MADLLARFKLVDEMSDKLGKMAEKGQSMTEQWERAGDAASAALEGITGGVSSAVTSVDGIATSIDNLQDAMGQADYWTDAVGNYSKELLEATYSTEELVEMGMKSADALEEQNRMLELCERSATELSQSMDATTQIQQDLSAAMDSAAETAKALSKNEDVSAEAKEALAKASTEAAEAMRELDKAQQEADAAMEAYSQTMASGTSDLNQLEAAAERAGHAAEALAEANGRATEATQELSDATEQASEEAEGAGDKGTDAIGAVAGALAGAGITAKVMEIAGAVYELAGSFSEAEKTIVSATGATGATGRELDEFMSSSLDVYASSSAESLNDVAVAMTSVQTATGLAGDALEEATDAALVLNNTLGYEVSESARTAGALIKNFGVSATEAYNLIAIGAQNGADKNGDLLDVLNEYSAQYAALGLSAEEFVSSLVDGAEAGVFSVDKVGDAVKEFNIRAKDGSDTTAEAFELLGMNADMMSEKFAAGGDTARTAFFEVVNALESMDDPLAKNAAAVGLFGTQYEDLEATVLPVLAGIEGGTLEMYDAVGTLAEGASSMGDEWQAAGNSIEAAFGSAITPAVSAGSTALAGFVQGVGEFLQEHPAVTKAITAIGVGLGVVVAGFALYAAGTAAATAVTALFGTTLSAAIWPITAIAAAIAAVTAAALFLVDAFQEDLGEVEGLTATTREQYYELQDLNAEYEEACEKYGETSEEALRLKYQVDDLTAAYEANKQTVEEFTAEVDTLIQSHDELISSYEESMTTLDQNAVGTMSLIQKLDDLVSTTNRTAAQEQQMRAVIDQLNTDLPDLALSYDDVTSSTEKSIEAMKQAAEAQAEQERQAEQRQAYVDLLKEQATLEEEIAKAEENVRLEQERMDNMSGWDHFWTGGEWDDLEAYQEALDELNAAYEENQATLQGIEEDWEGVAEAAENAAESPSTYEEAVAVAYENVRAKVEELCAAYDEAYQAALESFEGQFGLFDEAEADMDATVANAQAALDSQLAYWESYSANVETLKNTSAADLGITQENYEALMAYAQSGSEEAAGLAASMAEAINSGNTEAVAALANTVGEVQAAKETAAAAVADWQTNFTAQMDAIEQEMQSTIDGMNLSEEASAAASSTINSYANQIRAGKTGAVSAAREVASAVTSELSAANATIHVSVTSSGSVAGHAKGTTNAESVFVAGEQGPELVARPAAAYANGTTDSTDYFIAGENGPELIVGEQGSTVFPTQETDRLIDALNEKRQPLQVIAGGGGGESVSGRQTAQEQVKRILLEIAGSGAIEVSGNGADRETVLQIMWENLKPILMSIIQSEIYEEGDLSYDY